MGPGGPKKIMQKNVQMNHYDHVICMLPVLQSLVKTGWFADGSYFCMWLDIYFLISEVCDF